MLFKSTNAKFFKKQKLFISKKKSSINLMIKNENYNDINNAK